MRSRTPTNSPRKTHPVRWAATVMVVLVLGWDVWETIRESKLPPHTPPAITQNDRVGSPDSARPQSGAQSPD